MDPQACLRRLIEAYEDGDCEDVMYAVDDLKEWYQKGGPGPAVNSEDLKSLLRIARNYATDRLANTTLNEIAEEFLLAADVSDYGTMSELGDKLGKMMERSGVVPNLTPSQIRRLLQIANLYAHCCSDAEDVL